ncbi:unnamed protein product [Rhodiola kirilowii]
MRTSEQLSASLLLLILFTSHALIKAAPEKSRLFREYIGAEFNQVRFSDVPIDPSVEIHFILAFAIDYTSVESNPTSTNGDFNVFWDTDSLSPAAVSSIKAKHPNVKVALSLGGDTVANVYANFAPTSVSSWVRNAIRSITKIVQDYHLDGIDIDYEHFKTDPNTFAECIGRLLYYLKQNKIISFASIAPYADSTVQSHYLTLWKKFGHLIDHVNFQFYAYDRGTTVSQFMQYFHSQKSNYDGGKILVSFGTDGSGGLSPEKGFFTACSKLRSQGDFHGIFVWSADDSKKSQFRYEKQSLVFITGKKEAN